MSPDPARSVVLFAFHFPPESLPGAARPSRFFRYLPEYGYVPEVITGAAQPTPREHVHHVAAPTYIPNKYTMAGAAEILLHKAGLPAELALLWAGPASRAGDDIIRKGNVAAIISTAPPLNTHLAALRLKRKWGIPWIADFRDPLIGNPFRDFGKVSRAADRVLESIIFRHADLLLTVTDVIVEDWKARYPKWGDKMRVLWNGFDPAEPVSSAAGGQGPSAMRTLVHVGSLYGNRYPDRLLQSVQRLIERGSLDPARWRLEFVGDVGQDVPVSCASAMAALRSRKVVDFVGWMSRKEAGERMAAADFLLLLDITGRSRGYAVPSKLYEYIRTGRPVLAFTQRDSPVYRILDRSGIRHRCVYDDDNQEAVDSKVLGLLNEPSDPLAPSEWFLGTFDGRRQAQTLAELIGSLGPGT
jgi:glycosyltransferase involved in cell wall biosynthesis